MKEIPSLEILQGITIMEPHSRKLRLQYEPYPKQFFTNMKNQMFVVHLHSFVDLITNSSSELFVCDNAKSVDAVRGIIAKLLAQHAPGYNYSEVFGDVRASEFTFQWTQVPADIRADYVKHDEYSHYEHISSDGVVSSRYGHVHEDYQEIEKQTRAIERTVPESLYKTDRAKYDEMWAVVRKQCDELWTEYVAQCLKANYRLFDDFLRQSGAPESLRDKVKLEAIHAVEEHRTNKRGRYGRRVGHRNIEEGVTPSEEEAYLERAIDAFSLWTGYGINVNRGDVLIDSRGDNSIPWDVQEEIVKILGAERYHLG